MTLALIMPSGVHSQPSTLSANQAKLLDAVALLVTGDRAGERRHPTAEPIKRENAGNAIVYGYVWPSPYFGETSPDFSYKATSKYEWLRNRFRLLDNCVVRVDRSMEYSKGTSRDEFGQHPRTETLVLDFSKYRILDLNKSSDRSTVIFQGDKVYCVLEKDRPICLSEAQWPGILGRGRDAVSQEERRQAAMATIKRYCPGRVN
jgi:hypothetical protein